MAQTALPLLILLFSALFALGVSQTGQFVFLSDIHFDPFYVADKKATSYCRGSAIDSSDCASNVGVIYPNPAFGQWGCDSPYSLAQSTSVSSL